MALMLFCDVCRAFPKVSNMSGIPQLVAKYGDWFTHDKTPRALIFARNQTAVTDLMSMYKLMRSILQLRVLCMLFPCQFWFVCPLFSLSVSASMYGCLPASFLSAVPYLSVQLSISLSIYRYVRVACSAVHPSVCPPFYLRLSGPFVWSVLASVAVCYHSLYWSCQIQQLPTRPVVSLQLHSSIQCRECHICSFRSQSW